MAGLVLALGGCPAPSPGPQAALSNKTAPTVEESPFPWTLSLVRDTRRFSTKSGITIDVAPLDSTTDPSLTKYALVRIKGIRGELDGVTLLATAGEDGRLRTTVHGEPLTLIFEEHRRRVIKKVATGWFLAQHFSISGWATDLAINDASLVDGKNLIRRYKAQLDSGLLQRIAPTDRESRMAAQQRQLNKWITKSTKDCGGLEMKIESSTVEDGWFDDFSIANRCANLAADVRVFCNRHPHRVTELRARGFMTCSFAGHPDQRDYVSPRLGEDGGLIFTPSGTAVNSSEPSVDLRELYGESVKVLRGKKFHLIVRDEDGQSQRVYDGDGRTFYPNGSLSENPGDAHDSLPHGIILPSIYRADHRWYLYCGGYRDVMDETREELELLAGEERDRVLRVAEFKSEPKWKRVSYFLARDSRGVYYYVDRMRGDADGKRYRVFTGRRGQLKLSKLKGVVEDTVGTVFSTDTGELRLVVNNRKSTATWIRGKKKSILTTVNVITNRRLIYDELGAYFGEDFGFVCDL